MKYVWISILLVFISCVCVVHWREEVKKIPEVWTNRRGIKEAYCRKHCDHYGMCADSECVWESFRTSVNAYKSKIAWKSSKT